MSKSANVFRAGGLAPASALLAALLSVGFRLSPEQAPPVVENVVIRADGLAGEQDLAGIIAVRKGDPYSLKKIDQSVKQIFQTGLFSDVRVLKTGESRIELTFVLTHKLSVRKLAFSGGKALPMQKVQQAMESLAEGGYFSEDKAGRAVEEIRTLLENEGFYDAAISADVTKDIETSSADVMFRIGSVKRFSIAGISFEGGPAVPEKEIRKRMKTKEGEIYVPARFKEDLNRIRTYFNGLGYRRAEVELGGEGFDASASRVALRIRILAQEKIILSILGADVPVRLIEPIWEERVFEEWGLSEGEGRILSYLRKQGYVFATLKSRIERGEGEIRVIYEVSPGDKVRVAGVEFEGLAAFPADRIRSEIGISERMPFFALVDGERIFEIPGEIESFYRRNGFPDCRVTMNLKSRGKTATAVFYVDEGARRAIVRVSMTGTTLFPAATVRAVITSREGGPFYSPDVQKDLERIETYYVNGGVRGTRAVAEVVEETPGNFAVSFTVNEGRPVRIGDVIVTGNRVTRKKTILREVRLVKGDPASRALILETKKGLEALGVFSEVRIDEAAVAADMENLVITVREGERNYASLGVGLETRSEPRSLALWENDLRLRGTAEFIRSNILGIASQLSLVSQFSLVEKRAVAAWEQPYFFGVPMRTVLNAWLEDEDRTSFGFDRRGVSLNLVKPLFPGFALIGTLTWSRTRLTFLDIAENEVDRQLYPYSTTLASASVIWDRRNDTFNPTRGTFMSLVGEWAYPLFKTESDYLKAFFKFQSYFPVLTRLNFSTTVRVGLGRGRIPIPERFFAGGSNSFRGERIDALGPKDAESGMPVGGKAMFLVNLEMTFPLLRSMKNLNGAVFYDLGQVFSQRGDFSLFNFRGAIGWGLRYRTPLGPVRFDLGWSIDDPAKKGRPLAYITIGNLF
jgi:outer membrane protein insertion porin family